MYNILHGWDTWQGEGFENGIGSTDFNANLALLSNTASVLNEQTTAPTQSWFETAKEVPSYGITEDHLDNMPNFPVHIENIDANDAFSTLTAFESPVNYENSTMSTIGEQNTSSKTFNWDLVWNPARSFATESAATIQDLANHAPSIPVTSVTSEMLEGAAVESAFGFGEVAMGVQLAGQALEGVEDSLLENKISNFNYNAQEQYSNAMNTGHGIGYQNVASNNLMNALSDSANFKAYYGAMTSVMGPFGGMIALATPIPAPEQQTSYMANTASGAETDAQSENVVNTASA
ncbi:MAG: hypothetical protein FPoV2_gp2 [Fushun polycipivirus 2]|nr:MAG: hypothetical protein FPoV2_gp2 [Fushun polycipivirus 2]